MRYETNGWHSNGCQTLPGAAFAGRVPTSNVVGVGMILVAWCALMIHSDSGGRVCTTRVACNVVIIFF